jgi:hypothetical protein
MQSVIGLNGPTLVMIDWQNEHHFDGLMILNKYTKVKIVTDRIVLTIARERSLLFTQRSGVVRVQTILMHSKMT